MKHEELLNIIEGYHTNTDDNVVGVGYGYNISYLIPLYKKDKN